MSISGKYLTVKIGTTVVAGNFDWSVDETADKLEGTTGANNGRGKKDPGVIDCVARFRLYLDVTAGTYTALRAGAAITNLKLFLVAASTNPAYAFTAFNVFSSKLAGQVRDRFIVDVEGEPAGDVITASEPN